MHFKELLFVVVSIMLAAMPVSSADDRLDQFQLYTEDLNPPFSYIQNGELHGVSIDLILEIFAQLGIDKKKKDIVVMPWARAYRSAIRSTNIVLFATIRSADREDLFKWVGPLGSTQTVLMAHKGNQFIVKNSDDLLKYKYGVFRHTEEQRLSEVGVHPNQFVYVNAQSNILQMLSRNRIDAWATHIAIANWMINKEGYKVSDFAIMYKFDEVSFYFAFNKETDDMVIARFQKALDTLKANGTYDAICAKHLGDTILATKGTER